MWSARLNETHNAGVPNGLVVTARDHGPEQVGSHWYGEIKSQILERKLKIYSELDQWKFSSKIIFTTRLRLKLEDQRV